MGSVVVQDMSEHGIFRVHPGWYGQGSLPFPTVSER